MSVPIETITDASLTEKGFYWRERGGVKILICKELEAQGFTNGFSTRLGGVSPLPENSLNLSGFDFDTEENIAENRRRFLNCFDGDYRLATAWQIHSDFIKTAKEDNFQESEEKFDALISKMEGILAGVKTADCVPILMGDRSSGAFAAIHAGWRGTVESIAIKAIAKMKDEFASKPENLICAIGPAAVSRYEVGNDVIAAFGENFPNSAHLFRPSRENHAFIDLHQANKEQLSAMGVKQENIYTAPFCTMARSDIFFSYREDRKAYGQTGRLLSVIGKKQP